MKDVQVALVNVYAHSTGGSKLRDTLDELINLRVLEAFKQWHSCELLSPKGFPRKGYSKGEKEVMVSKQDKLEFKRQSKQFGILAGVFRQSNDPKTRQVNHHQALMCEGLSLLCLSLAGYKSKKLRKRLRENSKAIQTEITRMQAKIEY